MKRFLFSLWVVLVSQPSFSTPKTVQYASGTGFFVAKSGEFVTNAHVVRHCQLDKIMIDGAVESHAQLLAIDPHYDLAVLKSSSKAPGYVKIAHSEGSINVGDPLVFMGYPGQKDGTSEYTVSRSKILDIKGPRSEEEWIQFQSSAQHGNSGGPLLDESGNVVGVVTAKVELFQKAGNKKTIISNTDVAVAVPILKAFLQQTKVRFEQASSYVRYRAGHNERRAPDFIARIVCPVNTAN